MDDIQEAYTRYMVRRTSLRRNRDRNGDLNSTYEDLQKKYQLPTNRGSTHSTSMIDHGQLDKTHYFSKNSCTNNNNNDQKSFENSSSSKFERSIEKLSMLPSADSRTSLEPFELSNPKMWTKPPNIFASKESEKQDDDYTSDDSLLEPVKLLKVHEVNIEVPTRMFAELKKIENPKTVAHDLTQSSTTSLSEAIENLDVQIKNLELRNAEKTNFTIRAQVENSDRIYPVLENMKFDSIGYGAKRIHAPFRVYADEEETVSSELPKFTATSGNFKNDESSGNCEFRGNGNYENYVTREMESSMSVDGKKNFMIEEISREAISTNKNVSEDDGLLYQETPKMSKKMPIMESTRKSLHSDSTKIKFPTPTRIDVNSISSIGITNDNGVSEILNGTMPYEVEHFLEDALGDEFLNSTNMTYNYSEARDRTNSHFNASELISHDRTPLHRRIMQALKPPMTEPTSKNSSTLDRSMEIYRSFSQRIKKKFRSGIKTRENQAAIPTLPTLAQETDKIRELLQEVNVQQTMMNQAAKALSVCSTMKEFTDSPERIESERLLLLASLRRKCVVEEIKKITSEENKYEKRFNGQRGEITINNMSLNLREPIRREIAEDEAIDWFVLIISQGLKVWATRPISCRPKDSRISFPDSFSIPDLTPSFKIHVEIYTMKVRNTSYNHEDKYRIHQKHRRSTSCPPCPNILVSPTKLLKKVERPCLSPKIHYNHGTKNRSTSFLLSGFVELFLQDLSLSSPWALMLVPANSILQGTIDLNLACRLHLSVSHEGFVNDGAEAGGFAIWNRRWCVLKGHTLMFWNYPRDQETKEPLKIVDLIDCVSRKITTVDRTICAKPRTLLFETARPKSVGDRNSMIVECRVGCTIVRNLMSLDSVHELMEWSTKLNHVIMALREWNVIRVRTETQVSDL